MLYLAIYVAPGEPAPPQSIIHEPAIACYVQGWKRDSDYGVIAELDGQPVGAAWLRRFTADQPGYGFIAEDIPELTIAIEPEHRGQGIGTRMMQFLLEHAPGTPISLSCDPENPALRLYERLRFASTDQDRVYLRR